MKGEGTEAGLIMALKITVFVMLTFFSFAPLASADLFEDSQNAANGAYSSYSKSNSTTTWGVGLNMSAPYSGTGAAVQLGSGATSTGGCGAFNLAASIKSVFNKEVLDNYVNGLVNSIVSEAPLLLLCYASQTLCDLYKHYRNVANAALSLRNAQCQEVEKIAEESGTSLRMKSQSRCISEHQAAGEDLDTAMAACGSENSMLTNPSTGAATPNYNLVTEIGKVTNLNTENQALLHALLGDVNVSVGTGTGSTAATPLVYEKLISAYQQDYYGKISTLVDSYKQTWQMPSTQDLMTASPPDMPLHPSTLKALAFADESTRETMAAQLASIYGLLRAYYALEQINSSLQVMEENPNIGSKEERDRLQRDQRRLKDQIALIRDRVDIQTKYLAPALQAMEQSYLMNTGRSRGKGDEIPYTYPTLPGPMGFGK